MLTPDLSPAARSPLELSEDELFTLSEHGYFIRDGWHTALAMQAHGEAMQLMEADDLSEAGVSRAAVARQSERFRGDRITWLDQDTTAPALRALWRHFTTLQDDLSQAFRICLDRFEMQLAIYPAPNRGYVRHVDAFRDQSSRRLTTILYLNPTWDAAWGGQLRMYLPDGTTRDIEPVAGRLLTFLSEELEHEVLPTTQDRVAVTAWYRGPELVF